MVFVNFYHNYKLFLLSEIHLLPPTTSGPRINFIQRIGIFIRWIALSKLRATQFLHWIKFIRRIATYPVDSDLSTFRTTGPRMARHFEANDQNNLYKLIFRTQTKSTHYMVYKKSNRTLKCSSALNIQCTQIILSQSKRPGFWLSNITVFVKFGERFSNYESN